MTSLRQRLTQHAGQANNYPFKRKPFFDSTTGKLISGGVAVGSLAAGTGIFTNGIVTANATEAIAAMNGTVRPGGRIIIKRDLSLAELAITSSCHRPTAKPGRSRHKIPASKTGRHPHKPRQGRAKKAEYMRAPSS